MRSLILFATVVVANIFVAVDSYKMPTPRVELLSPRGFRVSIPDAPGIELFAFHGSINQPVHGVAAGQYSEDVYTQRNYRWTYRNPNAPLKEGDTLHFWTYAIVDGVGHQKLYQQFHVPGGCPKVVDDFYGPQRLGQNIHIS